MKNLLSKIKFLVILGVLPLLSCKEDVTPLTGDLKITVRTSDVAMQLGYSLYTESSLAASVAISPLRSGEINSNIPFHIRDLNPGNYSLSVNGRHNSVQVTAGLEREYKF